MNQKNVKHKIQAFRLSSKKISYPNQVNPSLRKGMLWPDLRVRTPARHFIIPNAYKYDK